MVGREQILAELKASADTGYREFHLRLIPGYDPDHIVGVRVPVIRRIAKAIAADGYAASAAYLDEIGDLDAEELFYEEKMLQGMVIGYMKSDWDEFTARVGGFIPRIDNWAVCDSTVITMKTIRQHRDAFLDTLDGYLEHGAEFEKRFALVTLLDHYMDSEYIGRVIDMVRKTECSEYYVMMAAAWCISECYIKFPRQAGALLAEKSLDAATQNRAISKIRDSYRVSDEAKKMLLRYRIRQMRTGSKADIYS